MADDDARGEREALARVLRDANEVAIGVPLDVRPLLDVADWLEEADAVLTAGWSRTPVVADVDAIARDALIAFIKNADRIGGYDDMADMFIQHREQIVALLLGRGAPS